MSALAQAQREFMRALASSGALPPGMDAYRRGVRENRIAALASAYPVVGRLVGDAFFREAAGRYGEVHPPESGDLHLFGARFAEFLAAYPHAAGLEYLSDVARLDWAVHESHHAPDAPPFDFAALAAIDPDDYSHLALEFSPAFRRVGSVHPIHSLWLANQPQNDGTPCGGGPQQVVVTRRREGVQLRLTDADEWDFLERATRGETLGDVLDALAERAARLPQWLQRYAAEEALAAVRRLPRA